MARKPRSAPSGLVPARSREMQLLAAGAEHHIVRCIRALIAQLVGDFAELEAIHPNVRRHIDVNRDEAIYLRILIRSTMAGVIDEADDVLPRAAPDLVMMDGSAPKGVKCG